MAYTYKKKRMVISVGSNPGERYLLAMSTQGKVSTEQIVEFIKRSSSISEQDIQILLRALADVIDENMEIGRGVNFEGLGVFIPNLRTKGSETAEDVNADNILKVVVNFRPATEFRKEMDDAKVEETKKFDLKHV